MEAETAPQAHPKAKTGEQESYKLREFLVAVTRFKQYSTPQIMVPESRNRLAA
jgi:hypothetical protein